MSKTTQELQEAVIRFAGDSGDGMQLTGGRFTETTAVFGNDLSTLPDFPAEIRAPAGSLAGVSAFQIKFSSKRYSYAWRCAKCLSGDESCSIKSASARCRSWRNDHL